MGKNNRLRLIDWQGKYINISKEERTRVKIEETMFELHSRVEEVAGRKFERERKIQNTKQPKIGRRAKCL